MRYSLDYVCIAEKLYDSEKGLYNPEKTWVDKIFSAFDFVVTLHLQNEIVFIKTCSFSLFHFYRKICRTGKDSVSKVLLSNESLISDFSYRSVTLVVTL